MYGVIVSEVTGDNRQRQLRLPHNYNYIQLSKQFLSVAEHVGMDRGGRGAAEITDGSTCFNTCE
jgi:hypothetical protein